jgi:hypothetical protein
MVVVIVWVPVIRFMSYEPTHTHGSGVHSNRRPPPESLNAIVDGGD